MRISDWSSVVCSSDLFGRDRRLTRAVVNVGQLVDQVARVARRIVHRGHRRTLFGRGVFKDALEDLDRDVAREQVGEDRFLVGFIFDRGAARCRNVYGRGNGDQLLAGRFLKQRRTELRIEEMRYVERTGFVRSEEHTSELQSLMSISYAV